MTKPLTSVMTRAHTCVMTPLENHTPRRTVRVDDALWNSAQEMAAKNGHKVSAIVRTGLERYVADDHLDTRSTRQVILATIGELADDLLALRVAHTQDAPLDHAHIYLDHPLWELGDQALVIMEAWLRIEVNDRRERWGWPADPENEIVVDDE